MSQNFSILKQFDTIDEIFEHVIQYVWFAITPSPYSTEAQPLFRVEEIKDVVQKTGFTTQ